ncbi:hypothetical protein [uncultured Chryseobacterium sp.]|uniref:hypothetical protein n=1 Tax=uncultured Chryseobacterium sp. TaxID=259322 RepID=UPI002600F532|nr:hypothetical protein [uncultured Chryseobacterium sp.]
MKTIKFIMALLILSSVNLTLMIPGGCIESRDFSQISPVILGVFNLFLTVLGIVSLFLVYFINKQYGWAYKIACFCGISYFIVYTIDLLKIFPQSPTPMPNLLLILETLGTILSIPLIFYALKKSQECKSKGNVIQFSKSLYWFMAFAIVIVLGIIIFATNAAMTEK